MESTYPIEHAVSPAAFRPEDLDLDPPWPRLHRPILQIATVPDPIRLPVVDIHFGDLRESWWARGVLNHDAAGRIGVQDMAIVERHPISLAFQMNLISPLAWFPENSADSLRIALSIGVAIKGSPNN